MKQVLVLLMLLLLTGCSSKNTVELTGITCDGIKLGDNIEDIDVNCYTPSERFAAKKNTINYKEWRITVDDNNNIKKIFANYSDIEISINSKIYNSIIDDVIGALGKEYSSSSYDRNQQLKQVVYMDRDNNIKATFVYSSVSKEIVWLIIEATVS